MKKQFTHIYFLCLIFSFIFLVFANSASAGSMVSGGYSIQADSLNFGGARSVSSSYRIEDTGGEVGTGDLQSSNQIVHAGYQQADAATSSTPSSPTSTPSTTSRSSSSGVRVPINVIGFRALPLNNTIALSWEYPIASDITSVIIVRSTTFYPTSPSDGDVIFEGIGRAAIDHDVFPEVQYYYTLFTRDAIGLYSSGVLADAIIIPIGGVSASTTPGGPFAHIPDAVTTDPLLAALTLADFEFIQDGTSIVHAGDTIVIDGRKNLTVRLAYQKVPQILKTIAISLNDPTDETRAFTFLLRANEDLTAYEATIGPLGKSGVYRLHAIVLDYRNQSLRRLDGDLRAAAFEAIKSLATSRGATLYSWLAIIVAAVLAIIVYTVSRRTRRHDDLRSDTDNMMTLQ